jgi:hypothetical protein
MNFEYVNQHYGVNACMGRRVTAYGKPGVIVKDMGHHIGIVLDSDPDSSPRPYHPIDGITYGEVARYTPPKVSRSKARYQEYLHADYGDDFATWLGIDVPRREYGYSYENSGMVRFSSPLGKGKFCKTVKEAKASYKAALKAAKADVDFWEAI